MMMMIYGGRIETSAETPRCYFSFEAPAARVDELAFPSIGVRGHLVQVICRFPYFCSVVLRSYS